MQHDVARKLTALASRPDPLSESEVSHFMTLCRKYLEHLPKEDKQCYPILKFFCNWSLHVSLDRSQEGLEMLKRINDTLVELAPVPDNDLLITRMTEMVSFRQLRHEVGTLLSRLEVLQPLNEDQERWVNFAKHLIEIIRDCPLEVGDDIPRRARQLCEAIKTNPIKQGRWVVGLAVIEVDYGKFSKAGKIAMCLHILMSDTTQIVIPMAAAEVFGPPT